ncbi:Prenylcysteine lyase-domain-containing protein [Kickxella alabastrina]|uniref:Prenylcysteine lyase-domain-containing protein n=1 Tax=Kickxella alabastrina TaxID=61397 RepID=UPI00221FE845|nr:Prenylcysteine lyase-domain-containing protein [Kickxella alabastrina]KAI7821259.1 Prenylcysteine lyase-domain-containing protein [Kickxella alabastrina]
MKLNLNFGLFGVCILLFFGAAGRARRIAIIGGGAAGAAAAYFAQEELIGRGEAPAIIHVFERDQRIGGRAHSGSVEYSNQTLMFEIGASMFIGKNQHLVGLARKFNLTLCAHPCTLGAATSGSVGGIWALGAYGLWDPLSGAAGGSWVVRQWADHKSRDALQMLWRYGGTGDLTQSYADFGDPARGAFASWDDYVSDKPHMQASLYYTAAEFYSSAANAIGRRLLSEVVSLATRINYMQDVDAVNAMGAHISMAAESDAAYSVAGGNWQLFVRMLNSSAAHVHLGTTVDDVQRSSSSGSGSGYRVSFVRDGSAAAMDFDSVIVAAPLPLANLRVLDGQRQKDAAAAYVTMHVTFAIGVLRGDLFPADSSGEALPRLIVTPKHTTEPFNCLSILACLDSAGRGLCGQRGGTVLVKIFSQAPVDLARVFARVEWQRSHIWDAYPRLHPRNGAAYSNPASSDMFRLSRPRLPPIVLDRSGNGTNGVYYVGGMETLFSTMESQTVAARHVVRLALFGEHCE